MGYGNKFFSDPANAPVKRDEVNVPSSPETSQGSATEQKPLGNSIKKQYFINKLSKSRSSHLVIQPKVAVE